MSAVANTVDWTSIIAQLLMLVATGVLVPALLNLLNLSNDDKTRTYLNNAMVHAIRAGVANYARGNGVTPASVLLSVANNHEVRGNVSAFAVEYLRHNTPKALIKLGVNGGLHDIITSRLDSVANDMAATLADTADQLEAISRSGVPVEKPNASFGPLGKSVDEDHQPSML